MTTLQNILNDAYAATVLKKGHIHMAHHEFQEACADNVFKAQARSELERCRAVEKKCFVSKTNAEFLEEALKRCR